MQAQYYDLKRLLDSATKDVQGHYSTGEKFLVKRFYELLAKPRYQNITVYHSLAYIDQYGRSKEIDFLIITKKGILIIESKHWKGTTYLDCDINDQKRVHSEYDIFTNTQYKNFAETSIKIFSDQCPMRVFVVRENDAKGTLVMRDYNNPVSQVRGYSAGIGLALGKQVVNAVVFHKDESCEVVFNGKFIEDFHSMDQLTSIVVDSALDRYLDSLGGNLSDDEMSQLVSLVEEKLTYHYKMDKDNYRDPKFKIFAGDINS